VRSFLYIPTVGPVVNRQWSVISPTGQDPVVTSTAGVLTVTPADGYAAHYAAQTREFQAGWDFLVQFKRVSNTASSRMRAGLGSKRAILATGGGESSTQGFYAVINEAGALSLVKDLASVETTLGGPIASKAPTANTSYWVRLSWASGRVRTRVWLASGSEPGTWDIDVADSGDMPLGRPEMSFYRSGGDGWIVQRAEVQGNTLLTDPGPLAFWEDNLRVPFGRSGRVMIRDDGYRATPLADLTVTPGGALTNTVGTLERKLTAAGSSSASVAWPALPANLAERIELKLAGTRLGSTTATSARLQLVGAAATYQLAHVDGDLTAKLTNGTLTQTILHEWIGTDQGDHKRNLSLVLLPRFGQLQAWMDDQCIGWLDMGAAVTESLTPTVKVDATTASARSLSYRALGFAAESF
jgi:hypothetical protein